MALTSPTGALGESSGGGSSTPTPPRFLPLSDVVTILASSANTHFSRDPLSGAVIRAKGRPLGTIADAITNVPTTWTGVNTSLLTSASASGDSITMTRNSTGTDALYNGTATAPHYKRLIGAPYGASSITRIFHIAATTISASTTAVRAGIIDSGNAWVGCVDFAHVGGILNFRTIVNNTTVANVGTRTAGEASTGTWIKIVVCPASRSVSIYYAHGSYAGGAPTTASGWTLATFSAYTNSGTAYYDCFGVSRETAVTPPVGVFSGWTTESEPTVDRLPGVITNLNAIGYAATSDAVTLGVWDAGTNTTMLPDITAMRLLLADWENRRPGDAATWTYSLTGSSSASPGAATDYQAAASLTLKVPGTNTTLSTAQRYWTLRAICTSSGSTQAGSIDTSVLRGLYAAAS